MLLGGGTGLAVGVTKVLLGLDQLPSFIDELHDMHVEPGSGAKIGLVALLGLMGGIPMGPEMGLGERVGGPHTG